MIDHLPEEATFGGIPVATWRAWIEEDAASDSAQPRELVNQTAAAELAGVSTRTIRDWETAGRITNHGERHSPLYSAAELPRRARRSPASAAYDPDADAHELVGRIG